MSVMNRWTYPCLNFARNIYRISYSTDRIPTAFDPSYKCRCHFQPTRG